MAPSDPRPEPSELSEGWPSAALEGEAPTGQPGQGPDGSRTAPDPSARTGPAWVTLGEASKLLGAWERTLRRRAAAAGLATRRGLRQGRAVHLYRLEALRAALAGQPWTGSDTDTDSSPDNSSEAQESPPDAPGAGPVRSGPDPSEAGGGALAVAEELREQVRFLRRQLEAREVSLARLAEALASVQARQLAAPEAPPAPAPVGEGRARRSPWLAGALLALAGAGTWATFEARESRAAAEGLAADALSFERARAAGLAVNLEARAEALGKAQAQAERAAAEAQAAEQRSEQLRGELSALRAAIARETMARAAAALPWPAPWVSEALRAQ